MKRHQVALIIALAWLAAVASMSQLGPGLLAAPLQESPSMLSGAGAPDAALQAAQQGASLIVRARVAQVTSTWAEDRSHLQSLSSMTLHYTLQGSVATPLYVRTVGGHLPYEELMMVDSEKPTLSEGEEVILFLAPGSGGYEIVGDHNGKYGVRDGMVHYDGSLFVESLQAFYARLARLDARIVAPGDWETQEASLHQTPSVGGLDYVYKDMKWATKTVPFSVNPNSARMNSDNGTEDDFLEAILNAATTWSMVTSADFTLEYTGLATTAVAAYDGANHIFFADKGLTDSNGVRQPLAVATVWFSNGIILDADIGINDAYAWDATGTPGRTEIDLESVVLHELGHWLALGHDPDSRAVMYYAITAGTLKRAIFDNDRRGIEFIYPCAIGQECNPASTVTATPTFTPSPTPTSTPTSTPTVTTTPTATPTRVAQTITRANGGVLEYDPAPGSHISLVAPPNAVVTDTLVAIEHTALAPTPPAHHYPLLGYFRVYLEPTGMTQTTDFFEIPVTLTVTYRSAVFQARSDASLRLLAVDDSGERWEALPYEHEAQEGDAHQVTASISQPSAFGLFRVDNMLYLPLARR
jgi:hypothetical protein